MATTQVGGREVVIEPITGYKAIIGGRLLSQAAKVAPEAFEALADFQAKYRKANMVVLTPELAKLPRFQHEVVDAEGNVSYEPVFTAEDFEQAGGTIELPADPSTGEQIAAVLPVVWAGAEQPVVRLIALVLSPNNELADADDAGTVDEYLDRRQREILHAITLPEAVVVVNTVFTMIGESLGGGVMGEGAAQAVAAAAPQAPAQNSTQHPSNSSPTSPTSSAAASDGTGEQSYTEPDTAN